jgi:hypothetical protein
MAMVANNPAKAKQLGIPQSVGSEYLKADKGKKFASGTRADAQSINRPETNQGKSELFSKGGSMATKKLFGGKESMKEELAEAKAIKSGKITPMQYAKGEKSEGAGMKKGGGVKKYAGGGAITAAKMGKVQAGGFKGKGEHAIQKTGISKGTMVKMAGSKPLGMKKGGKC